MVFVLRAEDMAGQTTDKPKRHPYKRRVSFDPEKTGDQHSANSVCTAGVCSGKAVHHRV